MTVVYRKGKKGEYKYVDSKNNTITDKEVLDYTSKLVIPPNYKDVKIFYVRTGQPKILYQGNDSKNRLQRIYSPEWTKKAARKKFCELLNFAEQIQSITSKVKEQMVVNTHTKNKMIALIMRIVMVCYFRIGNKKYQELYGSFGAMNIFKNHVKFKKDSTGKEFMFISFSGKKAVLNTCSIYDRELIVEVKKLIKFREDGEIIFQWTAVQRCRLGPLTLTHG
jgi:DNA topoisomerase-1